MQFSGLVQFEWEMPVPLLFRAGCIVCKVSRSCQVTQCVDVISSLGSREHEEGEVGNL